MLVVSWQKTISYFVCTIQNKWPLYLSVFCPAVSVSQNIEGSVYNTWKMRIQYKKDDDDSREYRTDIYTDCNQWGPAFYLVTFYGSQNIEGFLFERWWDIHGWGCITCVSFSASLPEKCLLNYYSDNPVLTVYTKILQIWNMEQFLIKILILCTSFGATMLWMWK